LGKFVSCYDSYESLVLAIFIKQKIFQMAVTF